MGDPHAIRDLDGLRRIIGQPIPGLDSKNQNTISDEARAYIERSPFLVLATCDADGPPRRVAEGRRARASA